MDTATAAGAAQAAFAVGAFCCDRDEHGHLLYSFLQDGNCSLCHKIFSSLELLFMATTSAEKKITYSIILSNLFSLFYLNPK